MRVLNILILTLLIGSVVAQTQITEGGFDNWVLNSTNVYYEPEGNYWTSLNALATLGGPVTVSPTTDAYSGEFAAQLETQKWGTILITGLLASGNFILAEPFILNGQPFSDKPNSFKGWYKYAPMNSDSAGVAAFLTRYNTVSGQRDTLATAIKILTENVQDYTAFDIDFDYLMPGIDPDSISILFTSSGAGGNFEGAEGSLLKIDDISLEYTSGLQEMLQPEFRVKAFPSPAVELINFVCNTQSEELHCHVYSFDGQLMQSFFLKGKDQSLDVSTWPGGKYILQAYKNNILVSTEKFMVSK